MITRSVLEAHHAYVRGDNAWQQRARLHQSLWRQAHGLLAGMHDGRPLGSRLTPADAEPPALSNYLSPQAQQCVEAAVAEAPETGTLLGRPRLWVDLLSSQPLCFNLFGPLAEDHMLAGRVLSTLWPDIRTVNDIRFEWSPGRGDHAYTGNRSAFDVFVDYNGPLGRSFLGIEVKYHEDLSGKAAKDEKSRYTALADKHGIFRKDLVPALQKAPLQQIWLDHLLALQLRSNPKNDGWKAGTFVLMYPVGNTACADGAARYRRYLTDVETFDARTLDDVVQAARLVSPASWPDDVYARYLDPTLVNATTADPAGE
ncbi:PGN_0703 family putative restriction endonuclease [Pseudonocardia saturnea]